MPSGLLRASIREKKRQADPVKRNLINRLRDAGMDGPIEIEHNELNFVVYNEHAQYLPFKFHHGKPLTLVRQKK